MRHKMSHCVVILPSVPSNKKGDCLTNSKSALDMISMGDLDEKLHLLQLIEFVV